MKKLLITDNHHKDQGQFSWLTPIKLANLDSVLQDWKEKVGRIYVMGDFFHTPNPSHSLVNACAEPFRRLGEHIAKVFFIVGNHDPLVGYESPFTAFSKGTMTNGKGMTIVAGDKPCFDEEAKSVLVSWSKGEIPKAPAPDWELYGHVQVKDWIKFSKEGWTLDELKRLGYKNTYLGDYHGYRNDKGIVSVGTFGASDFGDEGLSSGYVIVNEDRLHTRIILNYHQFMTFNYICDEETDIVPTAPNFKIRGQIVRIRFHASDVLMTESNIEKVVSAYSAMNPLRLVVERVYEREAMTEKKPEFQSLDELESRHKAMWPDGTVKEYDALEV